MPTGIPEADIAQIGLGAIQETLGLINQGKTKREADRLAKTRPQYQISPLAGQDLSLAQSELSNGMSAGAERAYNDSNNQQFSNSIDAILKSGGSVNNIGDLYGNNQDGRLKLAMMKDNLRLNQIQNYVRASQENQDAQQTQWQVNKFGPWADAAQANAQARIGANQQVNQGFNAMGAGLMNGLQASREGNQLNPNTSIQTTGAGSYGYSTGTPSTLAAPLSNTNVLTSRTEPFPTYNPQ